jgi:hypothetical protein
MTRSELDTRPIFRSSPAEYHERVRQWVATPALRELVEAEGASWPTGSLPTVLDELELFSAAWDSRGGQSRLTFHNASESRTDDRAQLVYKAARDLGLLDSPAPTMTQPDYLIILGGLATGVEPRARYAAELIERGLVSTGQVVALGSFRGLDEREYEAAERYAPDARSELDLIAAMAALMFGADNNWAITAEGDPFAAPARAQEVRRRLGHPEVTIYAARSSQPDLRPANTIDTYRQFAHDVTLDEADKLLIVTSTIYRPYQHFDALRALGRYGVTIETVGVPTAPGRRPHHPPSAYLQELRSTLRSTKALLAAPP